MHIVRVGAAHRELGLKLRVVRPEAQLNAAVGHQVFQARQQRVDVGFAEAIGVKALEIDG